VSPVFSTAATCMHTPMLRHRGRVLHCTSYVKCCPLGGSPHLNGVSSGPATVHRDGALQLIHWSMLEKVHCLALQTAAVTCTLVLVFYWAVVAGSGITGPYPDDYLRHAANAPIMLLDVWFAKVPFASYHLQVSQTTCLQALHISSSSLPVQVLGIACTDSIVAVFLMDAFCLCTSVIYRQMC